MPKVTKLVSDGLRLADLRALYDVALKSPIRGCGPDPKCPSRLPCTSACCPLLPPPSTPSPSPHPGGVIGHPSFISLLLPRPPRGFLFPSHRSTHRHRHTIMHTRTYTHIPMHTRLNIYLHTTHRHMHLNPCALTHICTHRHEDTGTDTHTHSLHTHTLRLKSPQRSTLTRTLAPTHLHTDPCTHTHAHTQAHAGAPAMGGSVQAPEGGLGRQSQTGVSHATRVVIPKARRLPANNTAVHSWPEISSPKHPRHVPAPVSHPCGFHPPAAPSWRSPRSWRHQHRRLGQGPGTLPSPGTPQRHPPTQARVLRSGLDQGLSSLHSNPSKLGKYTPCHLRTEPTCPGGPGARGKVQDPPPPSGASPHPLHSSVVSLLRPFCR